MSEGFLIRRGGTGGGQATGVCGIKAIWPEGMKCVVSSGTKKIRAGKDATEWIFMLPFAGEWTVTAGELSQTVSVAEGEIKTVSLSEGLRLLSKGVEINETLTGLLVGTTQKQSSSYTGTAPTITRGDGFITASLTKGSGNTSGGLMFNNTIDLSIYDTLHIRVTELTGAPTVWIGASTTSAFNSTSTTAALSVSDDLAVDISSLTGLKAVGFRFAMTAAGTQSVTVTDIWLEGDKEAFYLFKSGVGEVIPLTPSEQSNSSITVGTDSIITSYTASDYSVTQVRTTSKIDVTNYTKLGAKIAATAVGSGTYVFSLVLSDEAVSNGPGTLNSFDAYQKITESSTPAEYYLDISAFTGEQYVGLFGTSKATIYDIWLE